MSDYIIDVKTESGVVILESEDKSLLDKDELTLERKQWIVTSVEEEYDDFYNITRYTVWVY